MTDDAGFAGEDDEPIEIDVRSPGERWAESGRAGIDRLQATLEDARLDVVAVVWMLLVLAATGLQIYTAYNLDSVGSFQGSPGWWDRIAFLAQTGGFLLIFGGIVAIVMAAFFDTPAARLALRLAMLGGTWAVITSMFGIAVAFHVTDDGSFTTSGGNKLVQALSAAAIGGLGLVMAFVAWRMSARPYDSRDSSDPDLVELS